MLEKEGVSLTYSDPFTPSLVVNGTQYKSHNVTPKLLRESACVLILTGHLAFDYDMVAQHAPVIFDTRNAAKEVKSNREKIFLLS